MRKKTYSKTNYNNIATSFIIFLLLLVGIIIVSNAMVAQENELKIIIVDRVIEADKEFSVTVTDQNSSPVEGANVFIDSANVPGDITQSDGSANFSPSTQCQNNHLFEVCSSFQKILHGVYRKPHSVIGKSAKNLLVRKPLHCGKLKVSSFREVSFNYCFLEYMMTSTYIAIEC